MDVILKENVENLGRMGEVVKVRPGYARNYLIPKGFALEASKKNVKALEHEKRIIQERARKLLLEAEDLAARVSEVTLRFQAKAGEEEKLFGSVTAKDVAQALEEKGYAVDRRKVQLEEPIKKLGTYQVPVKVAPDVTATVTVEVVAESESQ
ncbi:MAG: 50S ribosomal protein L9 [Nitrospirota bacterium]|jgi:large subunit ribosomal protein L9